MLSMLQHVLGAPDRETLVEGNTTVNIACNLSGRFHSSQAFPGCHSSLGGGSGYGPLSVA